MTAKTALDIRWEELSKSPDQESVDKWTEEFLARLTTLSCQYGILLIGGTVASMEQEDYAESYTMDGESELIRADLSI